MADTVFAVYRGPQDKREWLRHTEGVATSTGHRLEWLPEWYQRTLFDSPVDADAWGDIASKKDDPEAKILTVNRRLRAPEVESDLWKDVREAAMAVFDAAGMGGTVQRGRDSSLTIPTDFTAKGVRGVFEPLSIWMQFTAGMIIACVELRQSKQIIYSPSFQTATVENSRKVAEDLIAYVNRSEPEVKPVVTRMTYSSRPVKKKLKVGDTKMIKGVMHVRRQRLVRDGLDGKLCVDHTNGRDHYEWVPLTEKDVYA